MSDREVNPCGRNPYTPQYRAITSAAHSRPPQDIGAPTLVWHVGVWPSHEFALQAVKPEVENIDATQTRSSRHDYSKTSYAAAVIEHNRRRWQFLIGDAGSTNGKITSLNGLLRHLQELGGTVQSLSEGVQQIRLDREPQNGSQKNKHVAPNFLAKPEPVEFTIWWRDRTGGMPDQRITEMPGYEPLRVRVQVETQIDYFALTFLIDVGKPWNAGRVFSSREAPGKRRKSIFTFVERVREICEAPLVDSQGTLEGPLLPLDRFPPPSSFVPQAELAGAIEELGRRIQQSPEPQTELLLEANKYLYATVWNEFCEDFGFKFEDIPGLHGSVFGNFRGLVISTRGIDQSLLPSGGGQFAHRASAQQMPSVFDRDALEPSILVRAFWPFIRRTKPFADHREHIVCGVSNWRELFITALGSPSRYFTGEESTGRSYEVPFGNLPELPDKYGKTWLRGQTDPPLPADPLLGPEGEEPMRYLLLTKYEPHGEQLGRTVDSINTLETMRLLATKNWTQIQEADERLRMSDLQLDEIAARWVAARQRIEADLSDKPDERTALLSLLNEDIEFQLFSSSAAFERISGDLSYHIQRSRYHSYRFMQGRAMLEVGSIEPWISYDRFAAWSAQPIFDFIEAVGHRVHNIRQRLAALMQTVQTSTFPRQIEETRKTTRNLEMLVSHFSYNAAILAVVALFFTAVIPLKTIAEFVVGYCKAPQFLPSNMCSMHARFFGDVVQAVLAKYLVGAIGLTLISCIVILVRKKWW